MGDQTLQIPEEDWRKLLAAASGDAMLLYVFIRTGGNPDQAQSALRLNTSRMECAAASLKQLGLWPETPKILRSTESPVYTEKDLIAAHEHSDFPKLLDEVQNRLGRIITTNDAKILLSFYDYLGLPIDVISLLISYCIQSSRAKGYRNPPTMKSIQTEAYRWAERGIETMEEAAAYMQQELEKLSKTGRIKNLLDIRNRKLLPAEEAYITQWIDWGFQLDVIQKAYEKTCMNTGKLNWQYLNSILKNWHDQKLFTLADIEARDTKPSQYQKGPSIRPVNNTASPQPSKIAMDAVARMMKQEG